MDFIQQTPLIRGLVNIPIQLDLICFCWRDIIIDGESITIAQLYLSIVRKLRCKDAIRMRKEIENKVVSERSVRNLLPEDIDMYMGIIVEFLGFLAFQGLSARRLLFDHGDFLKTLQDLQRHKLNTGQQRYAFDFLEEVKMMSVLHAVDADSFPDYGSNSNETWNFIHLTFQEYFTATWLCRYFQTEASGSVVNLKLLNKDATLAFIRANKYNPRFEVVWWMMAGQLEGEALSSYFQLLRTEPRDLIGIRHQILVAGCYKEASSRLQIEISNQIQSELIRWFRYSLTFPEQKENSNIFGKQSFFPEEIMISCLGGPKDEDLIVLGSFQHRKYLKPLTIDKLIQLTESQDVDIVIAAIGAIGAQAILMNSSISTLIQLLQHNLPKVRAEAAKVLGNETPLSESTIAALLSALQDDEEVVKYQAIWALGKQTSLSQSTTETLIATVHGTLRSYQLIEDSVLGRHTMSRYLYYLDFLQSEDPSTRKSAASIFSSLGNVPLPVVKGLIIALRDVSWKVRKTATKALGRQFKLGSDDIVPALVFTMQDTDPDVRQEAAKAIRKLGSRFNLIDPAVLALIAAIKDDDAIVRSEAMSALLHQNKLSESSTAGVVAALKDAKPQIRELAAQVLRQQHTLSEASTTTLATAFCDETILNVRKEEFSALDQTGRISSKSTVAALINALQDEDSGIRKSAIGALGKQATLSEASIEALIATLQGSDSDLRIAAALALKFQTKLLDSTIAILVAALQDEDQDVRIAAVEALGSQSTLSESTTMALLTVLQCGYYRERRAVVDALGKQSNLLEYIESALVVALCDEGSSVRDAAVGAFGNYTKISGSTVSQLLATENRDYIKRSLRQALKNPMFFLSIQDLSESDISLLFKYAFFNYGMDNNVSLFISDNQQQIYTEQGLFHSGDLSPEILQKIYLGFQKVHSASGIELCQTAFYLILE